MKNNQKGRSMIEMLGVLAIIGVLSVGGIAGYSKAMAKFRANKTIDQVSHIVANTRILFGSQKNYGDLGTKDAMNPNLLATANILPDEMRTNDKDAKTMSAAFINPYSGIVDVYAIGRSVAGDNRAFIISYYGIPKEACVDLGSQDWNSSSGSGLLAFAINDPEGLEASYYGSCSSTSSGATGTGDNAKSGKSVTCAVNMPTTVSTALAACTKDTDNILSWKFY